ncbi:MAG: endopeptidase La [Mariprofundaceae bacterium]|nr:endopeptidase La [Mariprofundaceae bacterium]
MTTLHEESDHNHTDQDLLPVLPLRDIVVFPHMIVPLFVGREKSVFALEEVMKGDKKIILLSQKNPSDDEPETDDLFRVGTLGNVLQLLKLPDGTIKVLIEGGDRVCVDSLQQEDNECIRASYQPFHSQEGKDNERDLLIKSTLKQFEAYVKLNSKLPSETMMTLSTIKESVKLAYSMAAHLDLDLEQRQKLLESKHDLELLELVYSYLESEMEILQVDQRIRGRVKRQMEKSQREYYLGEQMKAIQKELGEDDAQDDLIELEQKIQNAGMSREALEKAEVELKKLKFMPQMSAEATVVRNYLDWLTGIPWKVSSRIQRNLSKAEVVLDEDHFGLAKVKERILEYLAVLQLVKKMRGQILCFVGPPGVGKTSLAKSIARATKRKYVRMSLGGMRDEAEIRGHRRTYIGAMPGKIIQSMKKAGTKNPLVLLDEIDKMGADFRGDPASAMLEVLDPEQNPSFSDHYMEVEYDLSDVMFITTANTLNIPGPLLDRMEVIRLSGYTEDEKLAIASRYLLPRQLKRHGLNAKHIEIHSDAILNIIRHHTREAGVRNLERKLATMCRKVARKWLSSKESMKINAANLEEYLGIERFHFGIAEVEAQIGVVTGLAWTEVGGELLQIETALMPGKGKLSITGHIGTIMQESVQAALTYIRSRSAQLGLKPDFHQHVDIHVHVPEGAIPKDGPSAGLAMATSLASALTGIAIKAEVCMTGEITLRGKALPIGGLKEKLLAAHRGGLTEVIIPKENAKDLKEIPENVLQGLKIHLVQNMDDVLPHALEHFPSHMKLEINYITPSVAGLQLNEEITKTH